MWTWRITPQVHFGLLSYARFVTDEQRDIIVRNAAHLLEIHLRLQAKLQRVDEDLGWIRSHAEYNQDGSPSSSKQFKSSNTTVADAARRISSIFFNEAFMLADAYRPFCSGHKEAVEVIRSEPLSRIEWDFFEAQCTNQLALRKSNSSRLQFADFLIKPVQRICKYPLLFSNLLKYAPQAEDPKSFEKMTVAFETLKGVAEGVDEAQKQRILEIATVKLALRMDIHAVLGIHPFFGWTLY